jgi:hypothetical protein
MWVMALHAVHFPFGDGVVLGQMKLSVDIQVALITRLRVLPRIHNELVAPCASYGDVFAGRAVAGFAAMLARRSGLFQPQPGVGAGWKCARDVPVAIRARLVPHETRPVDHWRDYHCALHCGTGIRQEGNRA